MAVNRGFHSIHDNDKLDPADRMKIERSIYNNVNPNITQLAALPLERLQAMREESAAAERVVFESLQDAAGAWETQAATTLVFDNAIEYAKMPPVKHTSNEWQTDPNNSNRQSMSNMVYTMSYNIYENRKYDHAAQTSVPTSWDVTWNVRTNAPGHYHDSIAGTIHRQSRSGKIPCRTH